MIIQRRRPPNPRRGPSCLLVLLVAGVSLLGGYVIANADEVRDTITPDPTPTPTRSAVAYAASGDLLANDGEFTEAIEAYEAALRADPQNMAYILPLVELLLKTDGETDAPVWAEAADARWTALEWATNATELAPDDDRAWTALAAAYLQTGLRQAETGNRADAGQSYLLGVKAAESATQLNPGNAEAYAYMAGALAQLGREDFDFGLAQEMAEFAVALDPESVVARENIATVLELQGFYDRAIDELETALQLDPTRTDISVSLAYIYFFTDRRQQAILTMREAIEADPTNADAYDGLSYFYFVVGEYARAEENAFEAVSLDPDMTRGHAHLGAAYFKNNNYQAAIDSLETAVAQYGGVTEQNAIYYNMLGLAYYRNSDARDRCEPALPIFNAVLAVAPPDSPAEFNALEGLELCRQVELGN